LASFIFAVTVAGIAYKFIDINTIEEYSFVFGIDDNGYVIGFFSSPVQVEGFLYWEMTNDENY